MPTKHFQYWIGLGLTFVGLMAAAGQQWTFNKPAKALLALALLSFLWGLSRPVLTYLGRTKAPTAFPNGPLAWKLIRVRILIPDARLATSKRAWAEGLGKWNVFCVHNLWANRPVTKQDFAAWLVEVEKWRTDVRKWMTTAGLPDLDIDDFDVLGDVSDRVNPPEHQNHELNRALSWLAIRRERLMGVINRYRDVNEPKFQLEISDSDSRCYHDGVNEDQGYFQTQGIYLYNLGAVTIHNLAVELTAIRPNDDHISTHGLVLKPQDAPEDADITFRFLLTPGQEKRVGVFGVNNRRSDLLIYHLNHGQLNRVRGLEGNVYDVDLRITADELPTPIERTAQIGVDDNRKPFLRFIPKLSVVRTVLLQS